MSIAAKVEVIEKGAPKWLGWLIVGFLLPLRPLAAEMEPVVLWDKSLNLRGAFGYKDNVLLSQYQRQGSAFWQSAFDLFLLRASTGENAGTFTFFVTGEDRRYLASIDVHKEQLLLGQAKWQRPVSEQWKAGALAQYVYANQVFDASATEQLFQTLQVRSHKVEVAPFFFRTLPWTSQLEFKFDARRQFYNAPLDDYWETGPEISLSKRYGHKSEARLEYAYEHRIYDERRQFGLDAHSIPGTLLRFHRHKVELSLNHSWDPARHWRTRSRFEIAFNRDNGPGFYDYNRFRWSQRLGYYGADWEATIEGKILHYDYARQIVPDGAEIRDVWEYGLSLRGEKNLWRKLKFFAESEIETVRSNYLLEEYSANTVLGGFDWEF